MSQGIPSENRTDTKAKGKPFWNQPHGTMAARKFTASQVAAIIQDENEDSFESSRSANHNRKEQFHTRYSTIPFSDETPILGNAKPFLGSKHKVGA